MMKRQKTGGRRQGTPNKLNADIKQMILAAFERVGGEQYLIEQAQKNPTAFLSLLGKILPMQISGDKGNPLDIITEITYRIVDPNGTVQELPHR